MLSSFFADFHIHIGRDMNGRPVKITGSKNLTVENVIQEAAEVKGLDLIGIIDCHAPAVQEEMRRLIRGGQGEELKGGGIQFKDTVVIPGAEIEINDSRSKGPIHVLVFFPFLSTIEDFSNWLKDKMTNINLSSQRFYGEAVELQDKVKELEGVFIPAHIFTPFKSLYGKGVISSLKEVFNPDLIDGVELGLSSDTAMAGAISEISQYPFLSNSDAHSLGKIAREYNELRMSSPSFEEFRKVLKKEEGRGVKANYGLNPLLGKYHTTICMECGNNPDSFLKCEVCGSTKIVKGVALRINELADQPADTAAKPDYIHQIPLENLPSLGPKTFQKLLARFGTEMNVLHFASYQDLEETIGKKLAGAIIKMRNGELPIIPGGGGKYGRVTLD